MNAVIDMLLIGTQRAAAAVAGAGAATGGSVQEGQHPNPIVLFAPPLEFEHPDFSK